MSNEVIGSHVFNGKFYNLVSANNLTETDGSCDRCSFLTDADSCNKGYPFCKDETSSYFTEVNQENKGIKYDDGKIQWWYLPIEPIKEVLKVLHYGDKKYPADDGCNWKRVPNAKKRYYSALMRHITAWWDEEKNDQESGMHHLAHACTNVLFLLYFEMKGYPEDKQND